MVILAAERSGSDAAGSEGHGVAVALDCIPAAAVIGRRDTHGAMAPACGRAVRRTRSLIASAARRRSRLSFAKNVSADVLCGNTFITVMQVAHLGDLDNPSNTRDLPSGRTLLV